MSFKSLTVATSLVLGIVGCDDPEVQSKVADIMAYGAVTAEVTCSNVSVTLCHGSESLFLRAHKLIDGSSTVALDIGNGGLKRPFQFNSRSQGMVFSGLVGGSDQLTAVLDDGELQLDELCGAGPSHGIDTVDLDASCTGRNLSNFDTD